MPACLWHPPIAPSPTCTSLTWRSAPPSRSPSPAWAPAFCPFLGRSPPLGYPLSLPCLLSSCVRHLSGSQRSEGRRSCAARCRGMTRAHVAALRVSGRLARHGRHPTKPARLACWLPRGDRGLGSSYIGHRLAGASQIAPRSRRLLRRATGASQIASRSRRLLRRATGCGARRPRSLRPVAPLTRSLAPLSSVPQHSLRARGLQVIGLECT